MKNPEHFDNRGKKMSPMQRAVDGMSGRDTARRVSAAESAAAPSRPKAKPKAPPRAKNMVKPKQKFVDQRKAAIEAQRAADRAAIAAMKKRKK